MSPTTCARCNWSRSRRARGQSDCGSWCRAALLLRPSNRSSVPASAKLRITNPSIPGYRVFVNRAVWRPRKRGDVLCDLPGRSLECPRVPAGTKMPANSHQGNSRGMGLAKAGSDGKRGSDQAGEFPRHDSLALRAHHDAPSSRKRRGEGDLGALQSEDRDAPDRLIAIGATNRQLQLVHGCTLPVSRNVGFGDTSRERTVVRVFRDITHAPRAEACIPRQFMRTGWAYFHFGLVGRSPTRL